mmetsp:Transcript_4745/g.7143  ORF Transcript_4745/g.7143 Transcript_4745/m.7143 type:complete len:304 (+) Transcript_4745:4512-5423(+)
MEGNQLNIPFLGTLLYPTFHLVYEQWGYKIKIPGKLVLLLAAYGGYKVYGKLSNLLVTGIKCLMPQKKSLTTPSEQEWAVIVGADTEMGKQFALELAQRNYKLVLFGDSLSKLEKAIQEINRPDLEILHFTLTINADTDFKKLTAAINDNIRSKKIGILVNISSILPRENLIHYLSDEEVTNRICQNVVTPAIAMQKVIRLMVSKNSGLVYNVTAPSKMDYKDPLNYSGMMFLDALSLCYHAKYESLGVYIHSVRASISCDAKPAEAQRFVKNTLKWGGIKPVLHGGFLSSFTQCLASNINFK